MMLNDDDDDDDDDDYDISDINDESDWWLKSTITIIICTITTVTFNLIIIL